MNVITLPVQHRSQSQQPLVMQKEGVSSRELSEVRSPKSEVQNSLSLTPSTQYPAPLLVGRAAELAHLHRLFTNAMHGERQIVFVSGEAGIGKTTLVDAFLAQIRDRIDVRITSGQCVEQYGPGEAYLPLLEAIARLCRGPGGERRIAALQRYAPSWLAQLPSLLEPQEFERLQQRAHGTSRERMLREMAETAEGFSANRALVLVLEDLHWSDVSTLDWITYMARRREPAKLLIIGTYRPTDVLASNHPLRGIVPELQARGHCEELPLTPLAEEAIAEYLIERFVVGATGRSPLQAMAPVLHRRTGGNPLFVVNTVDDLIQQGVLNEEAGRWALRADAARAISEGVPDNLRQLIEWQLERLPEAAQRILKVASVAGVEFATAEVAVGTSTAQDGIEATCERLARTGQWLRAAGVAEWPDGTISGRYSFLHAVHHEVVYAQLAEVQRVQLHRRLATRKETAYGERVGEVAAELAVHFEKGRDLQRTVHYLGKAGENAVRRSAHQEAIAHLQRGLELLQTFPTTPERDERELRLDLALVESLIVTKGYGAQEVERACARARELCRQGGEPHQLLLVLLGLSGWYLARAELQPARELGEQLLRLAHSAHDPTLLPAVHLVLGQPLFHLGELVLAHTHLEQSTVLYDRRTYHPPTDSSRRDPGVASLCYEAWVLWLLGYPEQALNRTHAAFSLAQELADPLELALALNYASGLHYFRRERQTAQEQAEAAIRLSTEREFPFWAAMGTLLRGWALAMHGRGEEGVAQMSQGLAAWRSMGAVVGQPGFLAMLAEAQGEAGQAEEGLRTLADGFALVAKTGERYYEVELYRLKGELTLQKGARDWGLGTGSASPQAPSLKPQVPSGVAQEAEECFLKAIEIAQRQQGKSLELRAAMSLARLWQRQGKITEARELLEEIYGWFTEGFDTKDLQDAAALLRELGGRVRTGEENQKAKGKNQKSEQEEGETAKWGNGEMGRVGRGGVLDLEPQTSDLGLRTPDSRLQTPDAAFRSEGEYWTVNFASTTCRLKDARGLHFIAQLLQHPHQEFHVITLITIGAVLNEELADVHAFQDPSLPCDNIEGSSDAGEMLDPQARAAYKQRLSELREELAEAQRFHDLGRSEQLAAEIDFLTHELTSAVGLGGRARRVGSQAERARVNITRAIKIALRKITEHHPALGQHLATTIKTGAYCSYTPDTRLPILWQG